MKINKVRSQFADFLKESEIDKMLRLDNCETVDQDSTLKFERIDRYRVLLLKYNDLKVLLTFCALHDISVWIGADKLCIGYNYRSNKRLSAYSVPDQADQAGLISDRNISVPPEIMGLRSMGDRI